ncbi:MAG: rhomboid family intramembrane serine protease [Nanoarchaeota archaeon]|nr:rhomboid family intramembrane serine protease [Nanoarchaeota archaeon]MBU4300934.1 rhomboid family intramembrane serine protease [Nanoarchaeota archaeon]MBU4451930.1 rhomboid family intramembrane serine protease [Nanoarchaeota archaeon]MCG2723409.1 rhomboid family intramembrane serine protease [archaeon]
MGRITNTLILASIAASIYSWFYGADLAFSYSALLSKNYLLLITAIFAHASITHLAGNMLFLYIFGGFAERDLGAQKLLFAFFAGGILSFLLSIPVYPGAGMLGASAAIFTLAALAMLTKPMRFSLLLLAPVGVSALMYFIYNVVAISQGVVSNTAFVSHIIGFFIGIALGKFWIPDWKRSLAVAVVALVSYVMLINAILYYLKGYIFAFGF